MPFKSLALPAAFAFFHLALASAASFAFAAADMRRLGFATGGLPSHLNTAHRRLTPARILASPCTLIFRRLRGCAVGAWATPLRSWEGSAVSASIRSWMSAARRRACGEVVSRLFMVGKVDALAHKSILVYSVLTIMAVVALNPDGTYASDCALCRLLLTDPVFATSHFIHDPSDDLWPYSDAAMHWECYARWPHQSRFAGLYFESRARWAQNKFWQTLLHCEDTLVLYGLVVKEVSVGLRKTGSEIRVDRENWSSFLSGEWQDYCHHPLETAAVKEVLHMLITLL